MPYIKKEDRKKFERITELFKVLYPTSAGELNYIITILIHRYLENNGGNYQAINDILGALEGAKLELYRREVAPYEDTKIYENGDI